MPPEPYVVLTDHRRQHFERFDTTLSCFVALAEFVSGNSRQLPRYGKSADDVFVEHPHLGAEIVRQTIEAGIQLLLAYVKFSNLARKLTLAGLQAVEPRPDIRGPLVGFLEPSVDCVKLSVNCVKLSVDCVEPSVDRFEPLVDRLESSVDPLESSVDPLELLVDPLELLVDRLEPLIGRPGHIADQLLQTIETLLRHARFLSPERRRYIVLTRR